MATSATVAETGAITRFAGRFFFQEGLRPRYEVPELLHQCHSATARLGGRYAAAHPRTATEARAGQLPAHRHGLCRPHAPRHAPAGTSHTLHTLAGLKRQLQTPNGLLNTLLADTAMSRNLRQSLRNVELGTAGFSQNMDANMDASAALSMTCYLFYEALFRPKPYTHRTSGMSIPCSRM